MLLMHFEKGKVLEMDHYQSRTGKSVIQQKMCVCVCVCVCVSHSVVSDSCDFIDCSPPGSSHGILQARILEWVAIPFSEEALTKDIQLL